MNGDIIWAFFLQKQEVFMSKMLKSLCSTAIFLLGSVQAHAGIDYDLTLLPNQKESFANPFIWTSKVNCSIETTESLIAIDIKVVSGNGRVNGENIDEGAHKTYYAANGTSYYIEAGKFSRIELEKVQASPIQENLLPATAHCHL